MTTKVATRTVQIVLKMPRKIADYIVAAQKIHDSMAANAATLKAPNPVLATFQTHIDSLSTEQALAKTRAQGAVGARDAAKKVVSDDLNSERAYVESVASADPTNAAAIAGDAGMVLRKATIPTKPDFAVKSTTVPGTVKIVVKATKGARINNWQYSLDGGKTWIDMPPTTKANTTLENLTPKTDVMFRQRVITKAGVGDWTQPFTAHIT